MLKLYICSMSCIYSICSIFQNEEARRNSAAYNLVYLSYLFHCPFIFLHGLLFTTITKSCPKNSVLLIHNLVHIKLAACRLQLLGADRSCGGGQNASIVTDLRA